MNNTYRVHRSWRNRALLAAPVLLAAASAFAGPVPGQGTWQTTLLGRDSDGHAVAAGSASAVYLYDTALGVTWLRSASSGGRLSWDAAMAWAQGITSFGGGWALPTMVDTGTAGCNFSYGGTDCGYNPQLQSGGTVLSQLAYLWYVELGNTPYSDTSGHGEQAGWGLSNTGNFINLHPDYYWTQVEYGPDTRAAWRFYDYGGHQDYGTKDAGGYAMAMRVGDVLVTVPEPSSVALAALALGAAALARSRRAGGTVLPAAA